jgi:hypothetical protein
MPGRRKSRRRGKMYLFTSQEKYAAKGSAPDNMFLDGHNIARKILCQTMLLLLKT